MFGELIELEPIIPHIEEVKTPTPSAASEQALPRRTREGWGTRSHVSSDPEFAPGARNAVNVCLRVQPDEKVCLITDEITLEIATPNGVFRGTFDKNSKIEDVIKHANNTRYGLAAYVFTNDLSIAWKMAVPLCLATSTVTAGSKSF